MCEVFEREGGALILSYFGGFEVATWYKILGFSSFRVEVGRIDGVGV